ncbi:hypothetical protein [Alloactinosynnema sp. L-07]|nr:hypothetical protein [Alloactinosynnema sp. L-07]
MQTYAIRQVVLVVVHSVAAGERLLAAVRAIEGEPGVQVVFTQPPGPSDNRVADFFTGSDALITPWEHAAQERFDLVIAASPTGIGTLRGALFLLPEVSTDGEVVDHNGRRCIPALNGLLRQRAGNSEAVAIGLPHDAAVAALRVATQHVGRLATVVGDPSYDYLLNTLAYRNAHREHLGIRRDQRLGLVLSTSGPDSLLGRSPALLRRLAADLPSSGDRLVCHLHPDVWVRHGRRQVLAWAGPAVRTRMRFLPLGQGWQAAVAAADYVVGDHGAPTAYAAATGKPVFLANPMPNATPNSLTEAVVRYGKVLNPTVRLERQLDWSARPSAPVTQRVTSVPGRSTDLLRTQCLRLLRITSPARPTVFNH